MSRVLRNAAVAKRIIPLGFILLLAASTLAAQSIEDATAAPQPEVSKFDDWKTFLKTGRHVNHPVLWPPENVDAFVPPVADGVSCPLENILKGTRQRVQELLENVDRFTATEVLDAAEIGQDGRANEDLKYTFNYLAIVSPSRNGELAFDESREQTGRVNPTPVPIRTVGLAIGAAVFHPRHAGDFEIKCEGLGQWQGKPAWQMHFEQRPDKPPRFQSIFANGHWFDVKLKGRAWVAVANSQIQHVDFDLVEPVSPIRLNTEHMSVDYSAVDFPKRKIQLWLPESVNFYLDVGGHRFLNRHRFTDFVLLEVNTSQDIKPPKNDPR